MRRLINILLLLLLVESVQAVEYVRMEPECISRQHNQKKDWWGNVSYYFTNLSNTVTFTVENAQVGENYELRCNGDVIPLTADASDPTIYKSAYKTFESGANAGTLYTYQLYKNGNSVGVSYEVKVCDADCPSADNYPHALLSTTCDMTYSQYFEQMGDYIPTSTTFTVTKDNLRYGENGDNSFGADNAIFLTESSPSSPRYIWILSPIGQKICRRDYQYWDNHSVKNRTPYVRGCPVFDDIVYQLAQNQCTYPKSSVSYSTNAKQLTACGDNSVTLTHNGFDAPDNMAPGSYNIKWNIVAIGAKDYDCFQKVIIKAPEFDCITPTKISTYPDYGQCEKSIQLNLPETKNTNCITLEWSRTGYDNDYHTVNRSDANTYTDDFYPSPNSYKVYWKVTLGDSVKTCESEVEVKPLEVTCKNYAYLADGAITIPYPEVKPNFNANWEGIGITANNGDNITYTTSGDGVNANFPIGNSTIRFKTTLCKIVNEIVCPVYIVKKADPCKTK